MMMAVRLVFLTSMTLWLAVIMGCATEQPRVVRVQGDTFCKQLTDPDTGEFSVTWICDVENCDTPETATKIEKLWAKYQKVCGVKAKSTTPKR